MFSLNLEAGRFVTVEFIKADGSIRKINGRTGVSKYSNQSGIVQSAASQKDYILLYTRSGSIRFDTPRHVARNRILSVRADGVEVYRNDKSAYAALIVA